MLKPEFLSATKCVLDCFHIEKFRETQQDAILNLIKGKDVLISQLTASGKFVIFQLFMALADGYPYFKMQLIGKDFG